MPNRPGALAAIGKTPIVKLSSFPGPDAGEVWVKLEAANPTWFLQGPHGAGDDRGGRGARRSPAGPGHLSVSLARAEEPDRLVDLVLSLCMSPPFPECGEPPG